MPDLIVNVTGNEALERDLACRKAAQTELLGGSSALLIWSSVIAPINLRICPSGLRSFTEPPGPLI